MHSQVLGSYGDGQQSIVYAICSSMGLNHRQSREEHTVRNCFSRGIARLKAGLKVGTRKTYPQLHRLEDKISTNYSQNTSSLELQLLDKSATTNSSDMDSSQPESMSPLATIHQLPNELLLFTITLLPLKSLLAVRCVCQKWRHLVQYAHIDPLRREYLNLYDELIISPEFLSACNKAKTTELPTIDRKEVIDDLERVASVQGGQVPKEFKMYILEWPTKAICGWIWPGESNWFRIVDKKANSKLPLGRCILRADTNYKDLPTVQYKYADESKQSLNLVALAVWSIGMNGYKIVVMDGKVEGLCGTVHVIYDYAPVIYEQDNNLGWIEFLKWNQGIRD
jgi:F-box domain